MRYKTGTHVCVRVDVRYAGTCTGLCGVVEAAYNNGTLLGVKLTGQMHPANKNGWYYFPSEHLVPIGPDYTNAVKETGGDNMKTLTDYLNIAEMQFVDEHTPFRTYEYANYDPALSKGDLCVVATARHGLALAEVVDLKSRPDDADVCREIVSRVDTSAYDTRVTQRKKLAELKAKMQERAKKLQDIVLYQTLAKDDPEMAQLLSEYTDLNK